MRNSVLDYQFKKSFDTLKNIDSGMYGNRVVAIDLLTKKFDERILIPILGDCVDKNFLFNSSINNYGIVINNYTNYNSNWYMS